MFHITSKRIRVTKRKKDRQTVYLIDSSDGGHVNAVKMINGERGKWRKERRCKV